MEVLYFEVQKIVSTLFQLKKGEEMSHQKQNWSILDQRDVSDNDSYQKNVEKILTETIGNMKPWGARWTGLPDQGIKGYKVEELSLQSIADAFGGSHYDDSVY